MNKNSNDSFTHKLAHPVTIRDKSYDELTVRRPLVRDLIAADRQPGGVAAGAALVAICTGISFGDFGHVDAGDFRAILTRGEGLGFFPPLDGAAASGEPSLS